MLQEEGDEDNLQKLKAEGIHDIQMESNDSALLSDAMLVDSSAGDCGGVDECSGGMVLEGQGCKAVNADKEAAKNGTQQQVTGACSYAHFLMLTVM